MTHDDLALLALLAVMVEREKMRTELLDKGSAVDKMQDAGPRAAHVRSFARSAPGRGFAALGPATRVNRSRPGTERARERVA